MREWFAFLLLLTALTWTNSCEAITLENKTLQNGSSVVFLDGTFEFGDERKFASVAIPLDNAIVVMRSDGGNIKAAIEIGKAIHLKGFVTYVPDERYCASACAVAWLGGQTRLMSNSAHVGFHAAYNQKGDIKVPATAGNALVGAYLAQLGMPERAIIYITATAPDDIKWLTFADAQQIGIDVRPFDISKSQQSAAIPAPLPSQPTLVSQPRRDWTAFGEWIQLLSKPTQMQATEATAEYLKRNENTFVFRFANGWFVGAMGPYPIGQAQQVRDRLASAGQIPFDSLVTRGERFVDLVYGGTPRAATRLASAPSPSSASIYEEKAKVAYVNFHRLWSQTNARALPDIEEAYSTVVRYYGHAMMRGAVMEEKRQFAERWPIRTYTVRPGTLLVTCAQDAAECSAIGTIDWKAESPSRGAVSTGSAQYELGFRFEREGPVVIAEKGEVLSRQIGQR